MKVSTNIFLAALLGLSGVSLHAAPHPEALNSQAQHAVVVLLPRRLDYDVIATAVAERVSQLNAHKYWQAGYVACGVGLAVATWHYWPEDKESDSAPAAEPAKTTKTVSVKKPDGSVETTTETTEKPKEKLGFWQKELKYHRRSFVGALLFATASALIASGQKTVKRFFYWWKTPNKVALHSVLFHAAYNAFDSFMLRKRDGFLITDTDVVKSYNRVLRALQQFVVELSAQTIFLAQKEGVCVEDSIDLLLAQFSRDIDAANHAITQATEPFVGDDARCGNLLSLALESVGRIEDMYDGFLEDRTEEEESKSQSHQLSGSKGTRRG